MKEKKGHELNQHQQEVASHEVADMEGQEEEEEEEDDDDDDDEEEDEDRRRRRRRRRRQQQQEEQGEEEEEEEMEVVDEEFDDVEIMEEEDEDCLASASELRARHLAVLERPHQFWQQLDKVRESLTYLQHTCRHRKASILPGLIRTRPYLFKSRLRLL